MKCVTYNIHYGVGIDGAYKIDRIADAVRGAEIIALQEVSRGNPANGGRDMVAELRAALPDYFSIFGSPFAVDMGSRLKDGRAIDAHFEFGNMVLAKSPILSSRNLMLPRRRSLDRLNLQRGALEALIETPFGPVRFYSVHLDHRSPDERLMQIAHLMREAIAYPMTGGGLSGVTEMGFPEPPHPEAFMLLGDFNMLPGSPEYHAVCGMPDHEFGTALVMDRAVDAALRGAAGEPGLTCVNLDDPGDERLHKRIDYGFVSAGLAHLVKSSHVDMTATGSDHRPVWFEFAG
jgi:endonuclease/exonuclease/phosphatase family metal-dependent hydrolase